jgi:hypothetical protein
MKTKTNGWLDPNGIWPAWLACLPLPKGAKYTAMKTAIVNITDLPEYPEEVTSYAHLWASFARGITIPEMFVCIFNVLRCQMVHNYYLNMVLGCIIYRHMAAATTHLFNWDALNSHPHYLGRLSTPGTQLPVNLGRNSQPALRHCREQLDAGS